MVLAPLSPVDAPPSASSSACVSAAPRVLHPPWRRRSRYLAVYLCSPQVLPVLGGFPFLGRLYGTLHAIRAHHFPRTSRAEPRNSIIREGGCRAMRRWVPRQDRAEKHYQISNGKCCADAHVLWHERCSSECVGGGRTECRVQTQNGPIFCASANVR